MGDCTDPVGPVPAHFLVVRCTAIAALLVLLQSANIVQAARLHRRGHDGPAAAAAGPVADAVADLTELGRNIVRGLKLDRLPDMDKVDIDNNEFHCKYLEYFRLLHADGAGYGFGEQDDGRPNDVTAAAAAAEYDDHDGDDVSAVQIRGRVTHDPSPSSTDETGSTTTVITFPLDPAIVGDRPSAVIKSVARIHGGGGGGGGGGDGGVRVHVYGRLTGGSENRHRAPSSLADLTWPASSVRRRWKDVDVTHLLRRTGGGGELQLELVVRHTAAADGFRLGDVRQPVLHVFVDGPLPPGIGHGTERVPCPGVANSRQKRDGGRGRRRKPSPPPSSSSSSTAAAAATGPKTVRRTDCKAGGNGTEHGGGGGNKCCREEMRVVFADIPGFDFIVEPKSFDAGLCRGRCPAKYNPATRHAFIQSLLWKQHNNNNNNRTGVDGDDDGRQQNGRKVRHRGGSGASRPPPKPCCAPSKLDRLQIIHVDEMDLSSLKVTTWKEMAVVECACS